MSLESGVTFFIAIFIFAITPGPGVFAILSRALVSGSASCISLTFGMTVSDVVYLVLACFGLATIAENYGTVFTVIRFVGAAYLLYLGWKMWFTEVQVDLQGNEQRPRGIWAGCIQGFLISASNPKVILFYIAFLPSFMDLTALSHRDIAVVSGLAVIALMMGLMLVAVSAASARKLFRSTKAVRRLNRTAGGIMAGAGVYLAANS
jgi:threonine/homoserine/homoserine lactone efflux protein